MACLGSLNFDVLSTILEYVDDSSPRTTKGSICAVNKRFNAVAQFVVHRQKTVDLVDSDSARRLIQRWLSDPRTLQGIRHLTITGYFMHDVPVSEQLETWRLLAKLVTEISNLKVCAYKARHQPPLVLLEALHREHPKASLRVFYYERKDASMGPDDPDELALTSSPALTSFSGSIWSSGSQGFPDLREAAMRRIVATAPNLRFVSITQGRSGCVAFVYSPEQMDEQLEKEKPFRTSRPSSSVRTLHLDGFGSSEQMLQEWRKTVNLTLLENIKCSRGAPDKSFFQAAPTLLPNLSHLSVNFQAYHSYATDQIAAAAQTYLITCAPLKAISLWSWNDYIPLDVVLRHGTKLTSLELHERETTEPEPPRRTLSSIEIKEVCDSCPHLKNLTLDINRETSDGKDETINPPKYTELAAFPRLDCIQLYFDLGIAWQDSGYNYPAPFSGPRQASPAAGNSPSNPLTVDDDSDDDSDGPVPVAPSAPEHHVPYVKNLWRTLFAGKTSSKQLDVKNGEVERKPGVGYPAGWVIWESSASSHWRVLPNERDDRMDEPVLRVVKGPRIAEADGKMD
ncbi:MAG: hypothetical protein Q9160_007448 [Pyrenula sp. 1 TL-2023]